MSRRSRHRTQERRLRPVLRRRSSDRTSIDRPSHAGRERFISSSSGCAPVVEVASPAGAAGGSSRSRISELTSGCTSLSRNRSLRRGPAMRCRLSAVPVVLQCRACSADHARSPSRCARSRRSATAQPAELPAYGARQATDAIRVDGTLDEATWALSPRVGEMRLIHAPDRRPAFPTEAAVTWDATHLYVAFACSDPEPWARQASRDDRLWEEEVVEVFLDPDGDGREYAELEVSPTNVVVDLLIRGAAGRRAGARRWDIAGLQTAVRRHAAGLGGRDRDSVDVACRRRRDDGAAAGRPSGGSACIASSGPAASPRPAASTRSWRSVVRPPTTARRRSTQELTDAARRRRVLGVVGDARRTRLPRSGALRSPAVRRSAAVIAEVVDEPSRPRSRPWTVPAPALPGVSFSCP